ncbi:MAG: ArnT family glycosyltransferase [Phycisphaerae bacterium]
MPLAHAQDNDIGVPSGAGWQDPRRRVSVRGRAAGLVLVTLALGTWNLGDWAVLTPDSFAYLRAARSILETGGLAPERLIAPPGFPLLIAPFMAFGDRPFFAIRVLLLVGWAAAGVLTYLLYRRDLGEGLGWTAGLLVAAHVDLMLQSATVLTEMVYLPLSLAALLVYAGWRRRVELGMAGVMAGALLTVCPLMIRSLGLMLVPVGVLVLLSRRTALLRTRIVHASAFSACVLAAALAWNWRESRYPPRNSYGRTLTQARSSERSDTGGAALQFERLLRFGPKRLDAIKAVTLPRRIGWRLFTPPLAGWVTWCVGGFIVLLLAARVVLHRAPSDAYALLVLLLLAVWPYEEGLRLVLPLLPIFGGSLLWAVHLCRKAAGRRRLLRAVPAGLLALFLLAEAAEVGLALSHFDEIRHKADDRNRDMRNMAAWLGADANGPRTWVGITRDGDNSKLTLLGGAYLARRTIQTIDVRPGESLPNNLGGADGALVHRSLTESARAEWGGTPSDRVGAFDVFLPTVRVSHRRAR